MFISVSFCLIFSILSLIIITVLSTVLILLCLIFNVTSILQKFCFSSTSFLFTSFCQLVFHLILLLCHVFSLCLYFYFELYFSTLFIKMLFNTLHWIQLWWHYSSVQRSPCHLCISHFLSCFFPLFLLYSFCIVPILVSFIFYFVFEWSELFLGIKFV